MDTGILMARRTPRGVDRKSPPDVSIIGGGPAGATTAFAALKMNPNLDVEIHDVRSRPGKPVNCAGGIVKYWLDKMGTKLPSDVIANGIRGVRVVGPNKQVWEAHSKDIGMDDPYIYVTYRQRLDEWVLDRARKLGATIYLKSDPSRWHRQYHFPKRRYVIGADGWKSQLGQYLGLDVKIRDEDIHAGYEYRIHMPEYDEDYLTFFVSDRWSPEGYLWAFPEGNGIVKIGLGIPKSISSRLRPCINNFLEDFPEYDLERVEREASGAGYIPTYKPPKKFVTERDGIWYGLVGDAARMTDPIHGGGIWNAMIAGIICGKVIAAGEPLSTYQRAWEKDHRAEIERRYAIKETIMSWHDPEWNRFVKALQGFKLDSPNALKLISGMVLHLFSRDPKLMGGTAMKAVTGYRKLR